jgi:hypothetical protein
MRVMLIAILTWAGVMAASDAALAWSCVAQASDGAQGWSQNYRNENAAEQRALSECERYATSGDCEVQQCVPDNGKS